MSHLSDCSGPIVIVKANGELPRGRLLVLNGPAHLQVAAILTDPQDRHTRHRLANYTTPADLVLVDVHAL